MRVVASVLIVLALSVAVALAAANGRAEGIDQTGVAPLNPSEAIETPKTTKTEEYSFRAQNRVESEVEKRHSKVRKVAAAARARRGPSAPTIATNKVQGNLFKLPSKGKSGKVKKRWIVVEKATDGTVTLKWFSSSTSTKAKGSSVLYSDQGVSAAVFTPTKGQFSFGVKTSETNNPTVLRVHAVGAGSNRKKDPESVGYIYFLLSDPTDAQAWVNAIQTLAPQDISIAATKDDTEAPKQKKEPKKKKKKITNTDPAEGPIACDNCGDVFEMDVDDMCASIYVLEGECRDTNPIPTPEGVPGPAPYFTVDDVFTDADSVKRSDQAISNFAARNPDSVRGHGNIITKTPFFIFRGDERGPQAVFDLEKGGFQSNGVRPSTAENHKPGCFDGSKRLIRFLRAKHIITRSKPYLPASSYLPPTVFMLLLAQLPGCTLSCFQLAVLTRLLGL